MDGLTALAMLSDQFGVDKGQYALGGPVPDLALLDPYHSFARIMLNNTWREATTLRDPMGPNGGGARPLGAVRPGGVGDGHASGSALVHGGQCGG